MESDPTGVPVKKATRRKALANADAPRQKVNVSDVAKAAGVSVATVSRALNLPHLVRDEMRERVTAVAKKMGYSINPSAKALRLQKTHIIGAVIPTLDYAMYARMIHSFEEQMTAAGYNVFVLTTGFDNGNMCETVRRLVDRGAEALLLVGRIDDEALREYLIERGLPCVTTYSYTEDEQIPSIGFDNYHATKQVVEFLLKMGHRRMAMIAGPTKNNDRQQSRIAAFKDTLAAHGVSEDDWFIVEKSYNSAVFRGGEAIRQIRSEFPQATAVVCNSDIFAFSAMAECRRLGLRVPEDISISGFDDDDYATIFSPALTTVAVPAVEMGQHAAQALLAALELKTKVLPMRLDTKLVVRDSTSVAAS
ncbi:LacI family DNA-binding transcriptional regulator [Herbaspirillum huttiense]|uniref:LacI family DNA-binding transcriptional regulator n=1 Tax=Herbaspirillum huttiense TaxID=863372 RepID=UPI0010667EED|nr:LacI family DNA-binding transcriptional regulator [Herbaspirillum huttiense]QBP77730.1 LacI family DNA-binding transcriptional regulator [Herbaspirillum huttiense]